ncbi:multidrug resistance-associated protein 1-like [Schistocerca gregaria]|uniref:multidrug resistance-associated protein 1-like n=1 Tax=Schistocerca gregaria TaxID=7010 RepID=UPI00211ED4C2|nr:multidrug resistance-associated protein 1-like [Schistocerca gregaria]
MMFCRHEQFGPIYNGYLTSCFIESSLYIPFNIIWLIITIICYKKYYKPPYYYKNELNLFSSVFSRKRSGSSWALMELVFYFSQAALHVVQLGISMVYLYAYVDIIVGALSIVSWIYAGYLSWAEYKKLGRHSWVLASWWVGNMLLESLLVQNMSGSWGEGSGQDKMIYTCSMVSLALIVVQVLSELVMNSPSDVVNVKKEEGKLGEEKIKAEDIEKEDDTNAKKENIEIGKHGDQDASGDISEITEDDDAAVYGSLEERASIISKWTFSWLTPLLSLGSRQPLEMRDIPDLADRDKSAGLTKLLETSWSHGKRQGSKQSLFFTLCRTFGGEFALAGLFKLVQDALLFVSPMLMRHLIQYLNDPNREVYEGILIAGAMGLTSVLQSLFLHAYFFGVCQVCLHFRSSMTGFIFSKAFRLSFASMRRYTTGELVNLQGIDIFRIESALLYLHLIWSAPFQIIISIVSLYQYVGVSVFIGLLVIVLIVPINGYLSKRLSITQVNLARQRDYRNKFTTEAIHAIRVIKLFGWEPSFEEKLLEHRDREVKLLKFGGFLRVFNYFFWTSTPIFFSVVIYTAYTLLGNELTFEIAFPVLTLLNILRFPISILPNLLVSLIDCHVSLKRLSAYFLAEELDSNAVERPLLSEKRTWASEDKKERWADADMEARVLISEGRFYWTDRDRPNLVDLNFRAYPGQLVAIVGKVGAGKSSLLSAILGEMPKIEGKVVVKGSVAYCSQQAWIQNGTVRSNILFGKPFDKKLYEEAIRVSALEPDIRILPNGNLTEIGEKGINLSGGQKQRISLARAVYREADVYLFDDVLSAVDAHVSRQIFEECIKEGLKGKVRILVTHQIQYLSEVDHIVVLDEMRIIEQGKFESLYSKKGMLYDILESYAKTSEEKIEKDMKGEKKKKGEKRDGKGRKYGRRGEVDQEEERSGRETSKQLEKEGEGDGESRDKKVSQHFMSTEHHNVGTVVLGVYSSYLFAIGIGFSLGILGFFIVEASSRLASDYWLSIWSGSSSGGEHGAAYYISIYVGLSLSSVLFNLCLGFLFVYSTIRGAAKIHRNMLHSVLRTSISWFDRVPTGRILNRFSKDQSSIDETLPQAIKSALSTLSVVIGIFIIIAISMPWILVYFLGLAFFYRSIQAFYLASSRELQRLHSITRSPIFALFSETLNGLSTIRAYAEVDSFIRVNYAKVDANQRVYFIKVNSNRWLGLRLESLGSCIVFIVGLFSVLYRNNLSIGASALSLTYALQFINQLNWMVRMSTDVETELVCLERCSEYTKLEPEPGLYWSREDKRLMREGEGGASLRKEDGVYKRKKRGTDDYGEEAGSSLESSVDLRKVSGRTDYNGDSESDAGPSIDSLTGLTLVPRSWPSGGSITFDHFSLRYAPNLPLVLSDISCHILPYEKIGVVGRTGAGKTSLISALFRLIHCFEGRILIDNIDISKVPLIDLRSRLAIIPQDPTLFTGTIRSNLDPFGIYADQELWGAISSVNLLEQIQSMAEKLDSPVSEQGSNLSVGTRQLICLARALLRKPKILVMDEATASIDYETDRKVQDTIRRQFKDATVLTIAHRIITISDSDRVMVLDKGRLVEFDKPSNLLKNKKGIYYSLVKQFRENKVIT